LQGQIQIFENSLADERKNYDALATEKAGVESACAELAAAIESKASEVADIAQQREMLWLRVQESPSKGLFSQLQA
jgi:hypothetical protein